MKDSLIFQARKELVDDILPFWQKNAIDSKNGGFYGSIANDNSPDPNAGRSIVMLSRFLWTYSAAFRLLKDQTYLATAKKAYDYMMSCFYDTQNGGMFWSVKFDGSPLVVRKQIYGNAFALYALSEYAAALEQKEKGTGRAVMKAALDLFNLLEKYALDPIYGGYAEALAVDWKKTSETKLSEKDRDCDKSMNTNLHVMEAYTNLYRTLPLVFPDAAEERQKLALSLKNLVGVHLHHILGKDYHLMLYFNRDWSPLGQQEVSYGHDIEASWLLWEASCELKDKDLLEEARPYVLNIADVALKEGLDKESGGFENTCLNGVRDTDRIWWNQAEAVNGFYNAWQMSGESDYYFATEKVWTWIMKFQRDKRQGEWFWNVSKEGKANLSCEKGGNWKTSYHNGRCCMELLRRSNIVAV